MPEHDEFDERLVQRLRAYESRIPDGEIPMTASQSPRRSRSPLAAGGVIAIGALAGVLLAVVLLNRPADETGASPSPSASGQATPSAEASVVPSESAAPSSAAPSASAPAEAYTTIMLGDQGTATVAASGPSGAVILGYDDAGPVAWHSADGRTWQPAAFTNDPGADMRPTAVVASDLGYVAILANCTTECFGGQMIYSADGTSWSGTSTAVTGGILAHLAAGGPGFVAIAIDPYASGSPGVTPTVLTSADGQTWEAEQPADLLEANVHALASMGDQLVALGTLDNAHRNRRTAAGSRTDGRSWDRYDDTSIAPQRSTWHGTARSSWPSARVSAPVASGSAINAPDEARWPGARPTDAPGSRRSPTRAAADCLMWRHADGLGRNRHAREPPFTDAPPALAGRVGEPSGLPSRSTQGGELILESVAAHEGLVLFVGEVRLGDVPQPVVIVFNQPLP